MRIRRYEKKREAQQKAAEQQKQQSDANVDAAGLRQFGAGQAEALEAAFKSETIGLVTREEFVSARSTLAERFLEQAREKKRSAEEAALSAKVARAAQKAKLSSKSKLSFLGEDDDEAVESEQNQPCSTSALKEEKESTAGTVNKPDLPAPVKLGKDPTVETHFLPDRDRAAAETHLREQLKAEWALRQQIIKNEPLEITYSFWDGSGHRRKVTVRKGDSIEKFLRAVREQLIPDFKDLRGVSATDLMYVKEDIILPHEQTFYGLIVNKAKGKSGPLFSFDVHEDVRIQNDASVETDNSHAGKVVERHWYSRNKHIFPASRWEMYDPTKLRGRYTIHGDEITKSGTLRA